MLLLLEMVQKRNIGDKENNIIFWSRNIPTFLLSKINNFLHKNELEHFSMGKHLLLEVYDVDFLLLNDSNTLQNIMIGGINRAKMTILNVFSHCFVPQGCTIVIALAESHVSCHTWPENGCLAIDVYTCGDKNPKLIAVELLKYLNSDNYSIREINR